MANNRHGSYDHNCDEACDVWETRFEFFLKEQREFQELLCQKKYGCEVAKLSYVQRNEILKTHVLMLMGESYELLDQLNWKLHKQDRSVDWDRVREEFTDTFKLVLNFMVYLDISVDDLVQEFVHKSKIVRERFLTEWQDSPSRTE